MESITITFNRLKTIRLEIVLPLVIFAIPFIISGPQLLTGTLVNCLLFLSINKLSKRGQIVMFAMPSLGAIAHGILFGSFTIYLFYLLPFICLGNLILIWTYDILRTKMTPFIAVIVSALLKTSILLSFASIFVSANIIPNLFLTVMGPTQLITAISGGMLAIYIFHFSNK